MLLPKRLSFLFCLFFLVLKLSAQDKGATMPLKTILIAIEKQHQISFNYTEDNIANQELIPPKKSLSLIKNYSILPKKQIYLLKILKINSLIFIKKIKNQR